MMQILSIHFQYINTNVTMARSCAFPLGPKRFSFVCTDRLVGGDSKTHTKVTHLMLMLTLALSAHASIPWAVHMIN